MATQTCHLLRLPIELRLQIYGYALQDNTRLTIGSAELVGSHPDIVHRLYGSNRSPYPGLPVHHEPVTEAGFNPSLLSTTNPAVIPLTSGTHLPHGGYGHCFTAHTALPLVNKRINAELRRYIKCVTKRTTSLFISYPHGLHVLRTLTPHLLRQTRSIHIAGNYVSRTFCPARAACMGPRGRLPELDVKYNANVLPQSAEQLNDLIQSCFGPKPKHPVTKLELRIFYPGDDSYSTVWGDDNSPIVVALRNIHCAQVGIEVWRGRDSGTGVYLTARAPQAGDKRRTVSTVWRRLEEGRRGEPKCGSWIVDPNWPAWEDDLAASDLADATVVDYPVN
ncbi:hypothetical protein LTR78_009230 [Recurvomyces mirabilis]|uniref:Uncharacterized protein n=1 Tax=Recurvomyces mirabilis TaxID=574656 RepID=A0AAE0TP10_9PEZI|nr:hypothetical protein LTR78_009230 [Recurvomyces mirabilis]KAK5155610.1 hypothetical protein LTS14_005871 [Recurvomyces mirabilis]